MQQSPNNFFVEGSQPSRQSDYLKKGKQIFQGVGGLYQRLSYVVCKLELKKELIIRNYYFHSLVLHHYFWTALNVILVGYTKGVGNPLFSG